MKKSKEKQRIIPENVDEIYLLQEQIFELEDVYSAPIDNPPRGTVEQAWLKMEKIIERLIDHSQWAIAEHERLLREIKTLETVDPKDRGKILF